MLNSFRRLFALAALSALACTGQTSDPGSPLYETGRLYARLNAPTDTVQPGLAFQSIPRDFRTVGLYVPSAYDPRTTWPVVLLLHGSHGNGSEMAGDFQAYAEAAGVVIVAPKSRDITWDRIATGAYGVDVEYIDHVLEWAFQRIAVDPTRLAIAGFSDGGTYALLLGIKNGDLFTRIAAFAPCAHFPANPVGKPAIFIAHGTHDAVLPIAECSAVTVPELQLRGYSVEFVEYPSAAGDGHFVTPEVAARGFAWLAAK